MKRSVKNRIGYLVSILGIILLGVNFKVIDIYEYAVIKWMLKAVKATVIDVLILSHVYALLKAYAYFV